MAKETKREREILDNDMSDNRGIVYFPDCKGCVFAAPDTKWSKGYQKSICDVYKECKPISLMMGGECEYYDEAE